MRRGRRRLLVVPVVLVAVAPVGLTYPLFVFPATGEPGRADAVVVFAGGDGERQDEGVRLVGEGVAPVLVISDGGEPDGPRARLCRVGTPLGNDHSWETGRQLAGEWLAVGAALTLQRSC